MSKAQELMKLREKNGVGYTRHEFVISDMEASLDSYYENIISPEKIEQSVREYGANIDRIRDEFMQQTKLNKTDMVFLATATALQCVRQYILTPFRERVNDQEAAKKVKESAENNPILNKISPDIADSLKNGESSDRRHRYYMPSLEEVITNPVPFDANIGANGMLAGAGNMGHRGATIGHDCILGLIVGTANIATSTITNFKLQSYHITTGNKRDIFGNRANTLMVFEKAAEKLLSDDEKYGRPVVAAALIKEIIHLQTDIGSKKSLPLPVVTSLNPAFASELSGYGLDMANVLDFGKQASIAILINSIIAMLHSLYGGLFDENMKSDPSKRDKELYQVRTRKILLYSNVLASSSNIIYCALSENWEKLDLGGLAVTLYRIFSDTRFIRKIQYEFLNSRLDETYRDKFAEVEWLYSK